MTKRYAEYFPAYVKAGIEADLLDGELARFDLTRISAAIKPERDLQFQYLGLQTLYDRYLLQTRGIRFELPQAFLMRVAMGLALNEVDRETRAIEFYEVLSSFRFTSSTPTLFNSGTLHSQMSSCYLTTVQDDLHGIFSAIRDNAMLSKFAGGLGNDWTQCARPGLPYQGHQRQKPGRDPLPQGGQRHRRGRQPGRRKGAMCAYLETWHMDIEEFLELRKNTGDDRRRTHDMNTANWIPDLFMKRVRPTAMDPVHPQRNARSPRSVRPGLRERATSSTRRRPPGRIKIFKNIAALALWRKMLTMVFETGHPG